MSPDEIDLVLFNRNTSIHLEEGINVLDQVLGHQLDHCQSDIKHVQDLPSLIKQEYLEDEIFGSGQSTPIQSPARSSGNESCSAPTRRVKGHYDHYKDTSGKINLELISDEMERARVEAKRVKNREAAAKSRAKKKKQTEALEKKVGVLRAATNEVSEEIHLLREQANGLRAILSEHERLCVESGGYESD